MTTEVHDADVLHNRLRYDRPVEKQVSNASVSGWISLPEPASRTSYAMVLTHGAGSNCNAPILKSVAARLTTNHGWTVLRCDLPFRTRHTGPPRPTEAAADRDGLRQALAWLRSEVGPDATLFLGGHSYGGRQSTMLAAEDPKLDAKALMLMSYPLHPPAKPQQLRTAHLPALHHPSFFAHGSRDTFGTREEMEAALRLIPAPAQLFVVEAAGHDLAGGKKLTFADEFVTFAASL